MYINKAIKEIKKIEVAGPGFINFFISTSSKVLILQEIMQKKTITEKNELDVIKPSIRVVSANPTGPLMLGMVGVQHLEIAYQISYVSLVIMLQKILCERCRETNNDLIPFRFI